MHQLRGSNDWCSDVWFVQQPGQRNLRTCHTALFGNFLGMFRHCEIFLAEIHVISGSVEIAPNIGLAGAIFDIVSTGSTLITNGLREVHTVMHSEAVLIQSQQTNDEQNKLIEGLIFRMQSVRKAKDYKYIILNAPNESIDEICAILPGMKSPTITPLITEGWSSLYSVIEENTFWENIDKLKKAGAQGILVVPIEKMIV